MRFFLLTISRILSLFPPGLLLRWGDGVGFFLYAILRFRRGIVEENLTTAFGESLSEKERSRIALASYKNLCRTLIEVVRSLHWGPEKYRENVILDGWENVQRAITEGTGAFLLTLHMGNWEYAIHAIASNGAPLDVIVKTSQHKGAEKFLQWYRRKTGASIYPETGTAREILRSLGRGRIVGFVLDQFMGPPIGLPVTFFGRVAGTAVAPALLTEKKNAPVLITYSYRDEENRVHVVFEPPLHLTGLSSDKEERLFQKTQAYNDIFERLVRKYPEHWLWIHRRWKEFRGESRWVSRLAPALATAFLFALLGCSSTGNVVEVMPPPEPEVQAPQFVKAETLETAMQTSPTEQEFETAQAIVTKKKKMEKTEEKNPLMRKPEALTRFEMVPREKIPFEVGERLQLNLTWMALPAGAAVMEVRSAEVLNGRPAFHLWGNVASSRLVDAVYHVDNSIESYVDSEGFIPYRYLLHMNETHQRKETRVILDHLKGQAYFWSQRSSAKWGDEKQDRVDEMVPRSQDMFSGLYYLRLLDYELNKPQTFSVYENRQNLLIEALPMANELVQTKLGTFQCWKVRLSVRLNNALKPTGDIYVWISDDSKKYLVKFDAKLRIGSMLGTLAALRERR